MRNFYHSILAAVVTLTVAGAAFADELTKGKVMALDAAGGKVTIMHEDLKNLDMPAMTMVFRIGAGVDTAKLKDGADIEFKADEVGGELTVVEVR